jgi:predicted Zn-dependent protease
MSVINRVLQDLEQRNAGLDDADAGLTAVRAVLTPRARRRRVVPMAGAGMMILAAALWWGGRPDGESGQSGPLVRPMAFMASAEAAALVRPPVVPAPIDPDDATAGAAPTANVTEAPPKAEPDAAAPDDRFSLAYERAMEARDAGRLQQAEEALAELLGQRPGDLMTRQSLMGLMLETDRNLEAEGLATEGLRRFPAHLPFAMTAARLQAESGDLRAAIETLERLGAAGDGHPDFLAFHAALLQRSGLHAEAVDRYGQALAQGDSRPLWLVEQAISLRRLGREAEAASQLRRVASMKPLPTAVRSLLKRELALL